MKYLYIDFEYNRPHNKDMGLICAAVYIDGEEKVFWTRHEREEEHLLSILVYHKDRTIVCFSASAEARAFVALGLDPLNYLWIDLYLDFKQLINNDYFYLYNKYISQTSGLFPKTVIKESRGFMRDVDRFYSPEELEDAQLDHTRL